MQEIFRRWKSPRLQGHLVWIPMLAADDMQAAIAQETEFQDERINHFWDGERALGRLVSEALKLDAPIAWDIYLLYSPRDLWKGDRLPAPDFWMHQLKEPSGLRLDPERFKAEVHNAIERAKREWTASTSKSEK